MRNAQAQQIFVYMLTVIVVGMILLLGANYIFKIIDKMRTVDVVKFKTTLEEEASTYRNYGRWKNLEIPVPANTKEVCFIDLSKDLDNTLCDNHNKLMCDAWKDKTQNVLTEPFNLDSPIDLGNIQPKDSSGSVDYICIPVVGSKLKVMFAGGAMGRLEISAW